ncbi:hypothetical protein [Lysinibacillus antri]|uniref:Uncharacterized protein n=1 Tax=Lysinibacillus antri TaxID=2498145 RepID=A0A432LA59_9BACI|nr:hypothetical protein [Lysinibacillus antri]RUL51104.1 hypothetical protein EK386_12915 [Lysinibacillus antri]
MADIRAFKAQLQQKIASGTVTIDDLQTLATSARRTGSMSDRLLYARASRSYKLSQEIEKLTESEQSEEEQ